MSADRLNPSEECVKLVWENLISFPTPSTIASFPKVAQLACSKRCIQFFTTRKNKEKKSAFFLLHCDGYCNLKTVRLKIKVRHSSVGSVSDVDFAARQSQVQFSVRHPMGEEAMRIQEDRPL
jgi:hypothetical protein